MSLPKATWLRDCRDAFGEPPREFGFWDRLTYLRVPTPSWARDGDALLAYFRGRPRLLREGFVTWGQVIQANNLMWKPGPDSAPGEVVFSPTPNRDVDPEFLQSVACILGELKGTTPSDPESAAVAHHLTAEITRAFGMSVPRRIFATPELAISTVFFHRNHLPAPKCLRHGILPIIVSPSEPRIAMPLPGRYWPAEMLEWWSSGNRAR